MLRKTFILVTLIYAAGCDSPSARFLGGYSKDVMIENSKFRVFMQHGSSAVEVHRISIEPPPSLVGTLEKAYRAAEQVTGCLVVPNTLAGDQAIITAQIDCVLP